MLLFPITQFTRTDVHIAHNWLLFEFHFERSMVRFFFYVYWSTFSCGPLLLERMKMSIKKITPPPSRFRCDHSNSMEKPKTNNVYAVNAIYILFKWKCIAFGANLYPFENVACTHTMWIADANLRKIPNRRVCDWWKWNVNRATTTSTTSAALTINSNKGKANQKEQ